jgi:hypothetical protein
MQISCIFFLFPLNIKANFSKSLAQPWNRAMDGYKFSKCALKKLGDAAQEPFMQLFDHLCLSKAEAIRDRFPISLLLTGKTQQGVRI